MIKFFSFRLFALMGVLGLSMAIAPVDDAMAYIIVHPWAQQSHVVSNGVGNAGTWNYAYTLFNDSHYVLGGNDAPMPVIVDWELPYFSDAIITNIQSPTGWSWAIETIGQPDSTTGWDGIAAWQNPSDPLYQGANSPFTTVTQVLHWYDVNNLLANAIYPNSDYDLQSGQVSSLAGFGFTANYGSTSAPYQASWDGLPHWTGDPNFPLGVPGSPDTLGGTPVPEPATMLLLGSSLLGIFGLRRKIKK